MIKIAVCDDDRTVRESIVKALQRYERDNSMEFEILEYAAADAMLVSYPAELDLILLDPGPMLNDVLGRLLNQTRQASGLSQMPLSLTLDGNTIAIQISGYNALTDLVIPEEAHAALADGPEFWK